jgi:hypothetical protein
VSDEMGILIINIAYIMILKEVTAIDLKILSKRLRKPTKSVITIRNIDSSAYRILVGKPEGKRPLGRPRSRWVDNIKMDLREIGWDGLDLSGSG